MSNVTVFDLEEQLRWLKAHGKNDEIAGVQLKIERLRSCRADISIASQLKGGKVKAIVWPSVHAESFGFCLAQQVEYIFKAKTYNECCERFTFEPADRGEFLDVLRMKISALRLVENEEEELGDLVYAFSVKDGVTVFWRWDERENDFLIPLKDVPHVWRECDENEAYGVLNIQRAYRKSSEDDYYYVFNMLATKIVGENVLNDFITAAKFGVHREFVRYVLLPILNQKDWNPNLNAGLIMCNRNCRDWECTGWNSTTCKFDAQYEFLDIYMEQWLGWIDGLPPQDIGVDPVWIPSSLAPLMMDAFFKECSRDAGGIGCVSGAKIDAFYKVVQYKAYQIKSFCGIEFGFVLGNDISKRRTMERLPIAFRGFRFAVCDYTAFSRKRYRITLKQNFLFSYDSACAEVGALKLMLEKKYLVQFERLNNNFHKEGGTFRQGMRLVRRNVDSNGILRMLVESDFAYYAEKGEYLFSIYLSRRKSDDTLDIMISIEDRNVYLRDMTEQQSQWRKDFGNFRKEEGYEIL